MTINLSYFRQHGYKNNFRSLFSSLLTLKLSLLHKARVAMRFPAKITSSCHTCMLIELFYIGMPVVRSSGLAYGHMTDKIFSDALVTQFSYQWCSVAREREVRYNKGEDVGLRKQCNYGCC